MTRSESIFGKLIGGKDWRFERKKAIKKMMADIGRTGNVLLWYGYHPEVMG